ncbi:hypothetical protein MNAN1_001856 [Malassezia nana]|uniref:Uncharacterized protein n=1 Tax=Malassezia nana TaxID=180528 RepID=A0AAF0ERG3_9BASI|nr:hypothetical protein MNAN1_001856 [Malassezia nana]
MTAFAQDTASLEGVGGGFLVEDSLSGTFPSRHTPDDSEDTISVDDLPKALRHAGLQGSIFRDALELLESSAEPSTSTDDMVVPMSFFRQAVEALSDAPDAQRSKLKRSRDEPISEPEEWEDEDNSSSEEFRPDHDVYETSGESDADEQKQPKSKNGSKVRLTTTKKARAQDLFRLILERIPMTSSESLQKHEKKSIRPDISEKELHSRRIGVDELRHVAHSLNETPTTAELVEMLTEAIRAYFEAEDPKKLSSIPTGHPRIGLPECVNAH